MKQLIIGFTLMTIVGLSHATGLKVENAWARATPPGATTGALYMSIHAHHSKDRLVRASSAAADELELHTTQMENGVVKMRRLQAIEVGPSEPTVLEPGGMHIMLLNLQQPLKPGSKILVELEFEQTGKLQLEVPVYDAQEMPNTVDGDHSHSHENH